MDLSEMQNFLKELYEAIANRKAPWQRPWTNEDIPRNAVTNHIFTGRNAIILALKGSKRGYTDPRWLTYDQARSQGWYVKKGSKGTHAILCIRSVSGSSVKLSFRSYVLFHASQVEGIAPYVPVRYSIIEKNDKAENIIKASGARIIYGGDRAFYRPSRDYIQIPYTIRFKDTASYYSVLLHELGHWTGHANRLKRYLSGPFGSESYAFEELVAEISSMFLSGETGIPQTQKHFDNHAAYIESWLSLARNGDENNDNALYNAMDLAEKVLIYLLKLKDKSESDNKNSRPQ